MLQKVALKNISIILLSFCFAIAPLNAANLVAHWPLDETAGDTVKDAVGNHDGKFVGGSAKWVAGKFSNGLEFKGPNQHVEVPKSKDLEFQSLTLVAWVNFKAPGARQEVVSYADNYAIMQNGGTFHAFIHQGGGWPMANGTTIVKADTWYQTAITFDKKEVKLYVNGKLDGKTAAAKIDYQNFPLWFGGGPADNSFWLTGILDEIEIWDSALEEEEILKLFTSPPILAVDEKKQLATTWGGLKFMN